MNSELQDALELAQEYGCVVAEYTNSSLTVLFDDRELAAAYTRRVNQATRTLSAFRNNLSVTVQTQA